MRFSWDERSNYGLNQLNEQSRPALRDAIINWANAAGGWNPATQTQNFQGIPGVPGTMRVTATRTAADQVTIDDIEVR
jgi:hypothetical protein